MPQTLEEEAKRVISDCENQSRIIMETLSHHQRRELFRSVITGLFEFARPPMLEKTIHCITIHVMAQAIVDVMSSNTGTVHMLVEPCEHTTMRGDYEVPCWLVNGIKLYYLYVRSHFLPHEGTGKFTRQFPGRGDSVVTEVVFVNSGGKKDFRVRAIVDQFKNVVSKLSMRTQIFRGFARIKNNINIIYK